MSAELPMNARDLRRVAALLISFWTALLILCLAAPLGLALADEPASVGERVADAVSSQVVTQALDEANQAVAQAKAKTRAAAETATQIAQKAASGAVASGAAASGAAASAGSQAPATQDEDESQAAASGASAADSEDWGEDHHHHHHHDHHHGADNDVVMVGHDAILKSGESADSVVSVGGQARSEGNANDVVSVFGGTRVTGPASGDAVAVLGDVYVDSKVDGDVVAVLGDVELGPNAAVGGDVTSVMGTVKRDPAATIHGGVESVGGAANISFGWLRSWMRHCALLGRPLALDAGLGWAWTFALVFLAVYVVITLLFPRAVTECVRTLETQPGRSVLASFLMVLLIPLAFILLAITFIGLGAWPFLIAALFCASLLGKSAVLAWMGQRLLGARAVGSLAHPAAATLLGGVLVLVLYLVPALGFLTFNVIALLSLGVVVTTLLARARERRSGPAAAAAGSASPPAGGASGAAGGAMGAPTAAAAGSGVQPDVMEQESHMSESAGAATAAAGGASMGPTGTAGTAGAAPPHSRRVDPAMAATLPRAGFWIRMAALLIDVLLIAILASVLRHEGEMHLVVLAIYGALMWKLRGATVGQIVLDLQVARVDGRPVDWETAIIRALGCFLSLFVAGLGFFWIAFDENRQAWHDKIAGTVVVRVPKAGPPSA